MTVSEEAGSARPEHSAPTDAIRQIEAHLRSEIRIDLVALEELVAAVAHVAAGHDSTAAPESVPVATDEVLRARASRLTDLRASFWLSDWRRAAGALAVGHALGRAVLATGPGADGPPSCAWLVMAGADRIADLGVVTTSVALDQATWDVSERLFAGSPLAHRALADGLGVALAEAMVANGTITAELHERSLT